MPLLYGSAAIHLAAAAVTIARPRLWPWTLGSGGARSSVARRRGTLAAQPLAGLELDASAREQRRARRDRHHHRRRAGSGSHPARARGARGLRGAGHLLLHRRARERYPDLAQEIVRRGHSVENHTQRHRHSFSLLGPWRMAAEIAQAQECIARVTGESPRFFRAPAGLRNPFLEPILRRLKLQLASWTRRGFDTVNADADDVYRRLSQSLRRRRYLAAARRPRGARTHRRRR